jgi:hypothetical protein
MPHHRVPRASQDDAIMQIEREGEIIVHVLNIPDDPTHVDVYTRWMGTEMHVRSVS